MAKITFGNSSKSMPTQVADVPVLQATSPTIIEKIVEVPVERIVEVIKEIKVPFEVIKTVEKRIEVPVEKIKEVIKEVPVEVIKIVTEIKHVPVEILKEKLVEIPRLIPVYNKKSIIAAAILGLILGMFIGRLV